MKSYTDFSHNETPLTLTRTGKKKEREKTKSYKDVEK